MLKKIFTRISIALVALVLLVIIYTILGRMNVIPMYQCWASMGEDGTAYKGCDWEYGQIVG